MCSQMQVKKKGNDKNMGIGATIVFIVLIICVAILIGLHMCLCAETGTKMYADPKYEKRIKKIEEYIEELNKE